MSLSTYSNLKRYPGEGNKGRVKQDDGNKLKQWMVITLKIWHHLQQGVHCVHVIPYLRICYVNNMHQRLRDTRWKCLVNHLKGNLSKNGNIVVSHVSSYMSFSLPFSQKGLHLKLNIFMKICYNLVSIKSHGPTENWSKTKVAALLEQNLFTSQFCPTFYLVMSCSGASSFIYLFLVFHFFCFVFLQL